MPGQAPPIADEREGFAAYLRQQQDAFRMVSYGLTDEQARATPSASALSVGALLKHATSVQVHWLEIAAVAPDPLPDDPRTDEQRQNDYAAEFSFGPDDTLAAVRDRFDEVCGSVLAAVESLELGTPVPIPPAPWNPRDIPAWSVRWIWFHLIEELARHAGHADIIRESLDGATLYPLMAGYENWPATPWLTPWQPANQG